MMKLWMALPAAALVVACTVETPPATPSPEAQARLAAEIEGRVAEAPQTCVNLRNLGGQRSIDARTWIFDGPGNLIYVNRTRGECPILRPHHAVRTRTPTAQLCSGEVAILFDPVSGFEEGHCILGDFTAYRRM